MSFRHLVLAYAVCSACTIVANRWALAAFPLPAMLTLVQSAAAAAVVALVRRSLGVGRACWADVRSFLPVPALFALVLYSSSQLLHHADEGMLSLLRTATPIAVCACDHLFAGYELPSARSAAALVAPVLGAACYFRVASAPTAAAAGWGLVYYASLSLEMVCVKRTFERVRMSTWTRVLIAQSCAALFLLPLGAVQPEQKQLAALVLGLTPLSLGGVLALGASCLVGLALSLSAFQLRETVSATTFALVSAVSKCADALVYRAAWARQGSALGGAALGGALVLSLAYVPSEKRVSGESAADDEMSSLLVADSSSLEHQSSHCGASIPGG